MARRKKGTEVESTPEVTGDAAEPPINGHEQNGQPINQERKPPIFKVGPIPTGAGESIQAAVWEREMSNDRGAYMMYTVTLEASYKDGDQWKRSQSLKSAQIPASIYALQRCSDFIMECRDKNRPNF